MGEKQFVDLYAQFIDKDRHWEEQKEKLQRKWTPEDQALEDILWAS